MTRYDLRHLKDTFESKMENLLDAMSDGEVAIFLFDATDFANVQKAIDCIQTRNDELMNSLRFNEVDWTLVVKRKCNAQ